MRKYLKVSKIMQNHERVYKCMKNYAYNYFRKFLNKLRK